MLVDNSSMMIMIEHNLDMIMNADHIIDLGMGGCDAERLIVAQGTPEEVIKIRSSLIGSFLKYSLK